MSDRLDIGKFYKAVDSYYNKDSYRRRAANRSLMKVMFEAFVLKTLQEHLEKQGRHFIIESSRFVPMQKRILTRFDAYLPAGINDIDDPTFVEIKYASSMMSSEQLTYICNNAMDFFKDVGNNKTNVENIKILLIFFEKSRHEMMKEYKVINQYAIEIIYWDLHDLYKNTKEAFENNFSILENPVLSLLKSSAVSDKDKELDAKAHSTNMLKQLYLEDKVALVLGAGVSASAKVPQWDELVEQLVVEMINEISKDKSLSVKELKILHQLSIKNKNTSPLIQMRYIRNALKNEKKFKRIVHSGLYRNKPKPNTELFKAISLLCDPCRIRKGVQGVITYNFDDLLEKRLDADHIECNTIYHELDDPVNDKLNVYHVHGYLPQDLSSFDMDDTNIVFSEEEYHDVYINFYHWSNLVQLNYFRDHTCLFIGCSLSDPNMRRLLDVAAKSKNSTKQHYALMVKQDIVLDDKLESEISDIGENTLEIYNNLNKGANEILFLSLGIQVIWADNYDEIPKILKFLMEK